MLSDEELEVLLAAFQARFDKISQKYVELVGQHIADIGRVTASDLYRLKELERMGANLNSIRQEIAKASRNSLTDVQRLIEEAAVSAYGDYDAYGLGKIASNSAVLAAVRAQAKQTMQAMENLSNTTVVSQKYRECIDAGIAAVQSGVVDYKSAVRSTLRGMANDGLRVTYESGLTRRLDTAIRQNIIDGTRQINRAIAEEVGDQFGADGVEISAHVDCAADHANVQGRQYTTAQFEALQVRLKRPIGEWNCRHFAFPIVLGASDPAYSREELQEYKRQSSEPIKIGETTKSRYEWTQEQRKLETKVRYAKNEANAFKAAGDDVGRREAQARINDISSAYKRITEAAGVPSRRDRMAVAGFRQVNAKVPAARSVKVSAKNALSNNTFTAPTTNRFVLPHGQSSPTLTSYSAALEIRYQKGTGIGQQVYDRYVPNGGSVSDGAYVQTPHYSPSSNAIKMNFENDLQNPRGSGATWYHEHGHFIDWAAGRVSDDPTFNGALVSDCKAFVSSYRAGKNISLTQARQDIGYELTIDRHKKSAVSDLMEGASGGKIRGGYGHGVQYWTRPEALTSEAFAHMMEAQFSDERRELMKTYFPTAYAEFENLLKGLIP